MCKTHNPASIELRSNMYMYYAFGNHISIINDHLCIPCLADMLSVFIPITLGTVHIYMDGWMDR